MPRRGGVIGEEHRVGASPAPFHGPGSKDRQHLLSYFLALRYRIAIFYVFAKEETVIQRAEERGRATVRYVPVDLLRTSMRQCKESIEVLGPQAEFVQLRNPR